MPKWPRASGNFKSLPRARASVLMTCALRPHLIWGPGDRHLIPRIIQRGRLRQLRKVGDGTNQVDTTYVENAAQAHLQAGVDGFYASTQGGESHRFEDIGPFNECIKPYDLALMEEMNRSCPFNILHVCVWSVILNQQKMVKNSINGIKTRLNSLRVTGCPWIKPPMLQWRDRQGGCLKSTMIRFFSMPVSISAISMI